MSLLLLLKDQVLLLFILCLLAKEGKKVGKPVVGKVYLPSTFFKCYEYKKCSWDTFSVVSRLHWHYKVRSLSSFRVTGRDIWPNIMLLGIWLFRMGGRDIHNTCSFQELMPRSQSLLIKKLLFPQIYSVVLFPIDLPWISNGECFSRNVAFCYYE